MKTLYKKLSNVNLSKQPLILAYMLCYLSTVSSDNLIKSKKELSTNSNVSLLNARDQV